MNKTKTNSMVYMKMKRSTDLKINGEAKMKTRRVMKLEI